jgi:hypothetical protein
MNSCRPRQSFGYQQFSTYNPEISGVTKPNDKIKQIAETKTVLAIFAMSLSGKITHIVGA